MRRARIYCPGRRGTLLLLWLLLMPALCGCGAQGTSYTRLEQLRVVQTLGVDAGENGIRLSLATAAGDRSGSDAVCLSADGPTLSAALQRAQALSTEETLFCGHVRQLLVGERTALSPLLNTVGRSADLRLDTPLWLLRDASAETLMRGVGSGSRGITEVLSAVQAQLEQSGGAKAFTAGRILRDLRKNGSALACVLAYADAAEHAESAVGSRGGAKPARTAYLAGFAVVGEDGVRAYLGQDELLGIRLLKGKPGIHSLNLRDRNGANAALEVREGTSRVVPLWRENGELQGLEISVRVSASLLEGDSQGTVDDYFDDLTARLESAVAEQLRALLRRAKLLRADFLGLGERVEAAAPLSFRRLEQPFSELLPGLEISLSVQGSIEHEYDMR